MPEARDLYRETLLMLDACNLSGLAHSFSREIIPAICAEAQASGGTEQVNKHPLSVLWTKKMASLASRECLCEQCLEAFGAAYEEVKKRVQQGEPY